MSAANPVPVIAAGTLGLIAALWTWTLPGRPALFPVAPASAAVEVHILNNGFHTDLAVPRAALEARAGPLGEASRTLGRGEWVLIGWGDARFYVDRSPIGERVPDGLRAFFRPGNASVVMLDPEVGDPRLRFAAENRQSLRLSPAGFDAMTRRVEASLRLRDGQAFLAAARPGDDARFFASRETFWIGHLCNNWSARALNAAGLPVRPMRAATSGEVMAAITRAQPE